MWDSKINLLHLFPQTFRIWFTWRASQHDSTRTVTVQKKPVTTMLTYPWKCTVLHCNHLGNTWKPLVQMTRHFDYCPSASEGDDQSVGSSAPVVSRCFPGGYNVKLYISKGRLAWWLLAFLHSVCNNWLYSAHDNSISVQQHNTQNTTVQHIVSCLFTLGGSCDQGGANWGFTTHFSGHSTWGW